MKLFIDDDVYSDLVIILSAQISLRWKDVTAITKEKTALVIPNAILVCTETEKLFFTSFGARDKAYLMLFRVWQNALMDQVMSLKTIIYTYQLLLKMF